MASVLEQKPDPAAKFGSQVDEQIAQATTRIRTHDLALGGLTLAALTAGYAAAMISLDKYLNLPEWARQLALAGFLLVLAAAAYLLIARPLRRRINPLYAAARVEDTIEDAKNSVTGYVAAQENGGVSPAVKAAMSARAARAVGDADVNQAVDNRRLVIAGGVLVAFLVALAVLFFVFRPTQFASLVGRAFVPFSSDPIATRTQLELVRPDPADPTISAGQTVTVAVRVGGKVPPASAPDRVRLLIRHNPADPQYDELPMQEGESSRDWQLKVPEYLVQNGFWYKVAAGDAVTAEHRVTVRSLPLFTDYEAKYEYPAYTRLRPAKSTDPNLRAYRGTKVTLTAGANREVADARMRFEAPGLAPVVGVTPPDRNDAARFRFTATEATRYRLHFTAVNGEKNEPPAFQIAIDSDQPPRVEVVQPEEPETTAPANGQLAVDGTIGDDFGIDKYRLRLRVGGRDLAPVYPGDGKPQSLRREKDGTWPTDLSASGGFKLSADLPKLTFAEGDRYEPKEGDLVEFWVEAIDNCTETKPVGGWGEVPQPGNVGRSDTRRLRLAAPQSEPDAKEQLGQQRERRQTEEKQHRAEQQKKLDAENRPPPQPQDGQPPPEQKDGQQGDAPKDSKAEAGRDDGTKKPADAKPGAANETNPVTKDNPPQDPAGKSPPDGMDPKTPQAPKDGKKESDPAAKPGDPKAGPEAKMSDMTDSKTNRDPNGMGGGTNSTDPPATAPPPKSPDDKRAEQDAERVQEQLNKNKDEGGNAKPNPTTRPEDRADPAKAKPEPKDGAAPDSTPKDADPKTAPPAPGQEPAAEAKPQGAPEKPTDPAEAKPQPKSDGTGGNPAETREAPLGGTAGQDKPDAPEPKKADTPPSGTQSPRQDPKSGSAGKPDTAPKDGDPTGPKEKTERPADAGTAKPQQDPAPGQDKDPAQRTGSPPQPKEDPKAAGAKPEKAPDAATAKPAPPPDATEDKVPPKDPGQAGGASETRPAPPEPKKGTGGTAGNENKTVERGEDKPPQPKDGEGRPQGGLPDPKEKKDRGTGGEPRKLDPKEQKELEDAARNLTSPDPQKRKDAQQKLDRAVGEEKRKELEQIANDLESKDDGKRAAAQKKLDELKKEAEDRQAKKDEKGPGGKKGADPAAKKDIGSKLDKLTPEQQREALDAADDLTHPDPAKKQAARDKLDQLVGPDARKAQEEFEKQQKAEREKLDQDLKSPDEKTREAAEKKVDEALNRAEQEAKKGDGGKGEPGKLTEQEIQDLLAKARDLYSPDDEKRRAAEQAIDDRLGKDFRRRVQKAIQGPEPPPLPPPPEADPRHKARTAQLQLEEFEKNRYNKELHRELGWTQERYDEFLKDQARLAELRQKEAAAAEESARTPPAPPGKPTLGTAGAGKVDAFKPGAGTATGSGAGVAPPGFDNFRRKFEEELRKLQAKP
ncbi:MAG: hypothetical protein C0501_22515 [Isosphaera sp.]|nr:hypothetical protein [Isosphaera sp.]